ncbi:MAG: hypothetical protein M1114_03345 [Candidatus Dependentiae bacterium]|nr:hypothetical protein [Candidatus Dependentiae bacterium]
MKQSLIFCCFILAVVHVATIGSSEFEGQFYSAKKQDSKKLCPSKISEIVPTLIAATGIIVVVVGVKYCYQKFFEKPSASDIHDVVDREQLQQQFEQATQELEQVRTKFGSVEMAGKRAERNEKEQALQQQVLNSMSLLNMECLHLERVPLEKIKTIEEALKEKINEIYRVCNERVPTYASDDELRKKHFPRNARMSLTKAGDNSREYWDRLNDLQEIRIAYTDITTIIEETGQKMQNLKSQVQELEKQLKSSLEQENS